MDPRALDSFGTCWDMSALGSVLPSALHGGLSQFSAPAWGQTDVLQHGTMLGHPSMQLEVRTNICCLTRIFASEKCTGETAKCYLRSEHWHRAQPHQCCCGVRGDSTVLQC